MAYDLLLREGRINRMVLRNRIITGPMEKSLANRDGSLTARYIDYVTERARGGASLIQVESTYVDTRGMGHLYQVGCHGDHVIPGLRRMADAVHREGARVGLELYLGGRQTPASMSQRQPLAASALRCEALHPVPTPREMSEGDIQEVIGLFAAAARRVKEAGLDLIHLHGAHGYLLCGFLSPYSNRRTDRYGGSLANRARFGLEVLAAVRRVVGPDFPIGYRMSAEEYVDGGLNVEDTAAFSVMLADAGIDVIDVSGGIYESFPRIIQGPESAKGGFVRNAAIIKAAVGDRVPVSVAQRLNDPEFANEVLRREGLDFISLTRAFHADPHYVRKLAEGRAEEIVPCMACHQCTNLLEANQPAGCAANPQTAFERARRIRKVSRARNVLVVGGGPAGMQAARILAEQGNRVMLLEASSKLGGQIRYSRRVAADSGYLADFLEREMRRLHVDVRLNVSADLLAVAALSPDAVVVATGAKGGLNFWPVSGGGQRFDLFSAFDRPAKEWHGHVVIAGGDSASCSLALHIAGCGAEVHVIEPKAAFCEDKLSPSKELLLRAVEKLPSIHLHPETTIEGIGDGFVVVQEHGQLRPMESEGGVVVGGRTANNQLYEQLCWQMPELEVYNIGDSVYPREVYQASHEAAKAAGAIGLKALEGAVVAAGRSI